MNKETMKAEIERKQLMISRLQTDVEDLNSDYKALMKDNVSMATENVKLIEINEIHNKFLSILDKLNYGTKK